MYGNFEAYGRFNMNNCVSDRQLKMDFFVLFSGLDEINQYSVINLSSEAYLLSVIGSIFYVFYCDIPAACSLYVLSFAVHYMSSVD